MILYPGIGKDPSPILKRYSPNEKQPSARRGNCIINDRRNLRRSISCRGFVIYARMASAGVSPKAVRFEGDICVREKNYIMGLILAGFYVIIIWNDNRFL